MMRQLLRMGRRDPFGRISRPGEWVSFGRAAAAVPVVVDITSPADMGTIPEAQFYSFQFQATLTPAQPEPVAWSVIGSLPPGLTLSVYGYLSGIPDIGSAAVYPFTVRAESGAAFDQQAQTIEVTP